MNPGACIYTGTSESSLLAYTIGEVPKSQMLVHFVFSAAHVESIFPPYTT